MPATQLSELASAKRRSTHRHGTSKPGASALAALLVSGLSLTLASAALAGPTTTTATSPTTTTTTTTGTSPTTTTTTATTSPTTTTTTATSPTTTTTTGTSPTTTTTTTATSPTTTTTATTAATTTTTATTTTATLPTTTTTTTTTSSTTTTQPTNLSGQYPFSDNRLGSADSSYLNIDTGLGQMCVAGQVTQFDRLATPFNRMVIFTYQSFGPIKKATPDQVNGGVFGPVSLNLQIIDQISAAQGGPVTEYDTTISTMCEVVKASLIKKGKHAGAFLRCGELGQNFSAFEGLTQSQQTNIDNAFGRVKRTKAFLKKGTLRIQVDGDTDVGSGPPSFACNLSD